ncbi:MAG: response regulator, partial [Cytophagales bacterium]|nr:response regulator [Cytophagales bacterium]
LVITDQTMPDLTGKDLAKKIKEIRADIPIIICTGYSSKMDAETARMIGISGFIMKPFEIRELAKTVRDVLDSRPS